MMPIKEDIINAIGPTGFHAGRLLSRYSISFGPIFNILFTIKISAYKEAVHENNRTPMGVNKVSKLSTRPKSMTVKLINPVITTQKTLPGFNLKILAKKVVKAREALFKFTTLMRTCVITVNNAPHTPIIATMYTPGFDSAK